MGESGRFLLGLTFLLPLLLPAGASSQTVLGTVTDADDARPLEVAFVVLLDEGDRRVASTLTDDAGRFRLRAPAAGTYRARVERIGYDDTESDAFDLEEGAVVRLGLSATARAIELAGIDVEGDARCRVRPSGGRLTAVLWDDARKALAVTTWAQGERVLRFRTVRWRRALDPETLRVLEESRTPGLGFHSGSPYVSEPAEELQAEGYIRELEDGDLAYYAPDPAVLLSDAFLDAHCFQARLDDPPEDGWVGLDFRPVRRGDVADIQGTFWLDGATRELKRVEYRYTRLPADLRSDRPGGTIDFDRIPRGPWIVRRWAIRTPVVGLWSGLRGPSRLPVPVLTGLNETGGEVVGIRTPDGSPLLAAERAVLTGTVWDSVAAAPLARAAVRLEGTDFAATTDGFGRFRLDELPDGSYTVTFEHPRLETLGWRPEGVAVELVPGDSAEVLLALPPAERILDGGCHVPVAPGPGERAAGLGDAGTSVLVGRVEDAAVEVVLSWQTGRARDRGLGPGDAVQVERVRRSVGVSPGSDGTFRVCGLPADEEITVTVERAGAPAGTPVRVVLDAGEIRRVDLEVEAAAGAVETYATVRDAETGELMADVSVRVDDGPWVLTGTHGRAALGPVEPGAHRLELRHVAFGTWSRAVTVAEAGTHHWLVDIVPRPIELEGIEATVSRTLGPFDLFEPGTRVDRMTREDVDARLERGATDVTDLMLSPELPFLSIRRVTFKEFGRVEVPGVCVELARKRTASKQCAMVAVFVDDVPLYNPHLNLFTIDPHAVESIEVLQPPDATLRFGPRGGYAGAILIYTRRGPGGG